MKKLKRMLAWLAALSMMGSIGFLAIERAAAGDAATSFFNITSSQGTTFQQVSTGSGSLYSIMIESATAGSFVVCFDSSNTTGLSATLEGSTTTTVARYAVYVSSFVAGMPSPSVIWPPFGLQIRFSNGLACSASATGIRGVVLYRTTQ